MKKYVYLFIFITITFSLLVLRPLLFPPEFSRISIDIGMVVRDIGASTKFYTQVIGFSELDRFSVDADFSTKAGLTDGKALDVTALVLADKNRKATRLKLMQIPDVVSKVSDNEFIHSQLGFSYMTIYITDIDTILKRLSENGVKPLADGPILDGEDPMDPYLLMVADPDGNLIEIIGPKR